MTDSTGTAIFTYTGTATGIDSARASATTAGSLIESNTASVSWVTAAKPIIMSSVTVQFFAGDNTFNFDTVLGQQPLFTQHFPAMTFNPRTNIVIGNPNTNYDNPPLVNVTTDLDGNFTGTILPQGNGFVIGDANVPSYNAVFTGFLNVQVAGTYTIRTYHDDGFFWGVGGGAVRVAAGSTGLSNPPASGLTPFYGYPVMGSDNNPSNSTGDNVITFPVAGTYPFEYDLAGKVPHNWEGTITTIVSGVEKPIPPAGYLALAANTLSRQTTGATLKFRLILRHGSGAGVANTPLVFSVTEANTRREP